MRFSIRWGGVFFKNRFVLIKGPMREWRDRVQGTVPPKLLEYDASSCGAKLLASKTKAPGSFTVGETKAQRAKGTFLKPLSKSDLLGFQHCAIISFNSPKKPQEEEMIFILI